jgi:hypothetical protein
MRHVALWVTAMTVTLGAIPAYAQTESASAFGPRNTFLVSGYGFANAVTSDQRASSFSVGFSPIFLWKAQDKLFFEGELEFELEDGATEVGLEYAQIWWLANNYLMFGAGKFLNPTNYFMERLHPTWINKLPTMPLGMSGHATVQLIASTQVGAQVRGGIPIGPTKLTYAVYFANGPNLNTEDEHGDAAEEEGGHGHGASTPGTLNFSSGSDNNGDKAVGGRVAIQPLPELEIGYGIESAKVGGNDTEFKEIRSINHSADLNYVRSSDAVKGSIDVRGQFVWLGVDNPNLHPLEFENESSAWYGQFAYRPTKVTNAIVSNTEIVVRYDQIDLPASAPINEDQYRFAVGLDYWFTASGIFKLAFERITTRHEDGDETENVVIGQMTLGF